MGHGKAVPGLGRAGRGDAEEKNIILNPDHPDFRKIKAG
jgi:hypothetical protein